MVSAKCWSFCLSLIVLSETGEKMIIYVNFLKMKWLFLYPLYPKDRGMLWFYVEAARRPPPAARRPQWC